jgi:hypothetical protein
MTTEGRAGALFASTLQPSDHATQAQVAAAVTTSLLANGGERGCAAVVAAEYGEHPDTAAARMRWALRLAAAGPLGTASAA